MSAVSAPGIKIIVSSRDDGPMPRVAGAETLAAKATAHGWTARVTYAVADVPDRYFDNGNLAKPAHRVASVVVRLRRDPDRGWAAWLAEDGGPFQFDHAYVGLVRYGLRPSKIRPTINDKITGAA